jgi:molybdopterin synthase sulfur carrier subunit
MPHVQLEYFAMLRESRGRDSESLEVMTGTTVETLYRELFPAEAASGLPVAYAINQRYADATSILSDGDEVVFLPPVGGG